MLSQEILEVLRSRVEAQAAIKLADEAISEYFLENFVLGNGVEEQSVMFTHGNKIVLTFDIYQYPEEKKGICLDSDPNTNSVVYDLDSMI